VIAYLRGRLRSRADERLVVDVGGVGYLVQVPVGVVADRAVGEEVELHVSTQVREDAIALFGFEDAIQLRPSTCSSACRGSGRRSPSASCRG